MKQHKRLLSVRAVFLCLSKMLLCVTSIKIFPNQHPRLFLRTQHSQSAVLFAAGHYSLFMLNPLYPYIKPSHCFCLSLLLTCKHTPSSSAVARPTAETEPEKTTNASLQGFQPKYGKHPETEIENKI